MILVLGTGRSGTSTVARLLHTKCSVSMGLRFKDPDSANPLGYYEDLDFLEINTNAALLYETRFRLIKQLFTERKEPWGLKEPRTPYWWRIYRECIDKDTKIIIATRAVHLVIQSLKKNYGWSETDSLTVIRERCSGIEQLVKGFDTLTIDFTNNRTDEELTEILTNHIR